jgi:hypothetical protein
MTALQSGATADAVWNPAWGRDSSPWEDEFSNAVSYATRYGNITALEALVKAGASLNTRHLAMAEAATTGTSNTARRLVAHGARVNGWKDERYWPIHRLMTQRKHRSGLHAATGKLAWRVEWRLHQCQSAAFSWRRS